MTSTAESILEIERKLQDTLRPIQPDPAFIGELNERLITPDRVILEVQPTRWQGAALLSIGLAAGLILMWFFQRGRG